MEAPAEEVALNPIHVRTDVPSKDLILKHMIYLEERFFSILGYFSNCSQAFML